MSSEPGFNQAERYTFITAAPIARDGYPLGRGYETLVTIARNDPEKGNGPWSFIVDEAPGAAEEGVPGGTGPSPVATTLGGLAA